MYWGVITLGKCGGICRRIKGEQKKACFSLAQRPSFEFCVHVGVVQGLNGIQNPLRGVHHYKGYYTWWGITCGYANVIQVMLGKSRLLEDSFELSEVVYFSCYYEKLPNETCYHMSY